MEVYLTDEELIREKNIFEAHTMSYKPLKKRSYKIKDYVNPNVKPGDDRRKPPPSC